jgi:uncharacterized HAD superfamily protein/adenine/guanine phosphoribosyltransferase-like PRPP-binding protein
MKDLNDTIVRHLHKVPRNLNLVVGIPRSGLLAAHIVALNLNLPITDIEGLIEGRLIESGERRRNLDHSHTKIFDGKILVIDDSLSSGSTMMRVKQRIQQANLGAQVIYSAVFVAPSGKSKVDFYFEEMRGGRVFEWNLMHSYVATQSCVDIDGVLCADPTAEENDDGQYYERFLLETRPLRLPTVKLGYLVTCMMNLPDKESRLAAGNHAAFKADVYRTTEALLFIESSLGQARDIAKLANKPVLCTETQQMIYPSSANYAAAKLSRAPNFLYRRLRTVATWLRRRLLDLDPPQDRF